MCGFLYPLLLRAFFPGGWIILMGVLTTAFVIFMHRENIQRLWNGKESKISFSRKSKKAPEDEGGTP
jgi:glycerol-3-phosphate acyltransferase PlsY